MFVPHQLLYFTGLRCCVLCLYTTIVWFHRLKMLLTCYVCPTPIALFQRFKMLLCLSHSNCFTLFHRFKMLLCLSHTNCFISDWRCCCVCPTQLLYFTGLRCCCVCTQVLFDFTGLRCCCVCTQVLFDFTGLRCCCVCPTPIALFHRFKMLLCLSHTNCFISQA